MWLQVETVLQAFTGDELELRVFESDPGTPNIHLRAVSRCEGDPRTREIQANS